MEPKKKSQKLKIIFSILAIPGSILILGGIFYGGKKFGESRYKKQIETELETKIAAKENEINSLKEKLKKETNSTKKQELEQKVRDLEQQLAVLKNPNNPSFSNNYNQIYAEWSGSTKNGFWLFTQRSVEVGQKEFVHIAQNHPIFKNKKLAPYPEVPVFLIKFWDKDASKKEGDNTWYFDSNNNNFEIKTIGRNWPDETPQGPNRNPAPKTEKEVRLASKGEISGNEYAIFDNFNQVSSSWQLKHYNISINHPLIKLLEQENGLIADKKFILKYKMVDETKENLLFFKQNNSDLELYQLD